MVINNKKIQNILQNKISGPLVVTFFISTTICIRKFHLRIIRHFSVLLRVHKWQLLKVFTMFLSIFSGDICIPELNFTVGIFFVRANGSSWNSMLLPPANEVCEGYVFTGVCLSTPGGGACMVLFGGHVWFYLGGVHGFIWGVCVVLFRGDAWFYSGGMHGFIGGHAWFYLGACVVLFGGACVVLFGGHAWFYLRGHAWFYSRGACMVLFRGACVVLFGGMCGFIQGHVWFYLGGHACFFQFFWIQ